MSSSDSGLSTRCISILQIERMGEDGEEPAAPLHGMQCVELCLREHGRSVAAQGESFEEGRLDVTCVPQVEARNEERRVRDDSGDGSDGEAEAKNGE
ncbi:unnamed protein product [Cutaneotrichosporon oleaginosum]